MFNPPLFKFPFSLSDLKFPTKSFVSSDWQSLVLERLGEYIGTPPLFVLEFPLLPLIVIGRDKDV